jgi:hypothetical protein
MKQLVKNYTFNATAKTVTLGDYTTLILERLELIVDTTSNAILYNFADSSITTASVSTNVITLGSVGSASSTDKLMVIYDSQLGDPTYDLPLIGALQTTSTYSTTVATPTTALDAGNYRWISVQVSAQGTSSTVTFQASNDNSTWFTIGLSLAGNTSANPVSSTTSTGLYHGPLPGRYFRLNITGISAGTTSGTIVLSSLPAALQAMGVSAAQIGTWAVTANAGTNLNTSALALETGGNLATIAGAISSAKFQDNIAQFGGSNVTIGQQLAASSIPVILPAATITTLTPPAALTNFALETGGNLATLAGAVSSSKVNVNISSGNITGFALDATLTSGNQQTKVTNGTNIADVLSGDSGNNGQVIAPARKEVAFTTTSAQAVGSTDASNYRWVSVYISGQGATSTVTFQASNDNTNWVSVKLTDPNATNTGLVNSTTGTGMFTGQVPGRYFRLNVTGITSGTTAGTIEFFGSGGPNWMNVIGMGDVNGNPAMPQLAYGDGLAYPIAASQYGYTGSAQNRLRTPTVFKTTTATASGNTAVWTPTSGKKFRLMRFMITLTANVSLASAGLEEVTFQDATTGMPVGFSEYVPGTAVTTTPGGFTTGWIDLGNGILSASANNVLNINLGTTLATGECRVLVCGTEE